ncbi:MAG: hypothetical protein WAS21_00200 [Geminicoccaceae bacterium]
MGRRKTRAEHADREFALITAGIGGESYRHLVEIQKLAEQWIDALIEGFLGAEGKFRPVAAAQARQLRKVRKLGRPAD